MSLTPNYSSIDLQSPFTTPYNLIFLRIRSLEFRECRVWKRRRLKTNRRCAVRNQLGPFGPSPFENLFQNLVSQFPSVNSLDLIAPALGFASGVAFYLSRFSVDKNLEVPDIGEWILFTSPTPFNRFVLLRCPSISFDGGELLEDVNEKLVKEDRHFVRLNSGRIQARDYSGRQNHNHLVEKLEYQRVCVGTDDGGVISLDWPTNLELEEEHGLDTTLLLIPGTAQGSLDKTIRSFVCECLKRGFFPVVMNPRGCAGSPLTTARLFTAADSDDICTAIQFVNKARPWTTLMGVGWGYGANMLTKYLAEVGEKTPLTAATCIDNPFDLEEATRSSPYHIAINQKITGGLIDILRSNKELFQGKTKGYDVEKALSAKSVRDFEKAISIVTHGFDSIEDFYSKSSTRGVIGNVKIPVLFIQNDDGTVPLFSIPRSLIAENPYTSLLLCSSVQSSLIESGRSVISWCQHLIIEWLAAVELGLLKGRHPLLLDVDVTINPSKGLALMESRSSDKEGRVHKLPELAPANAINEHFVDPTYKMHRESDTAASIQRSRQDSERNLGLRDTKLQEMDNGALQQSDSLGTEMLKEDEVSSIDNKRGQVLQTTQVVMNMLDVTMPETLTEEQKKKVLTAVGQGETLMKALQDAVPEDVRGKLTNAVSGLLHSQGTNLKIEGLLRIGQEKGPETSQRSPGLGESQPTDSDYSPSAKKGTNDSGNNTGNDEFYNDKNSPYADHMENGPETSSRDDQINTDAGGGVVQSDIKDDNNIQNSEEMTLDSPDQNNTTSSTRTEESLSPQGSSSEAQLQGNDNLKREDKNIQPILDQNMSVPSDSNPPTFSVSQALDALTGMDDSTQVAVNSIFGVIEDMITNLEEAKDNGNELQDRNEVKDIKTDYKLEKKQENKNELSLLPDVVHFNPAYDAPKDHMESHIEAIKGVFEEKLTQNPVSVDDNVVDCSLGNNTADLIVKNDNETEENLVASEVFEDLDGFRHVVNIPLHRGISLYGDSFYKEYYKKYLLSKMPDTKSLDMDTTATLLLDYIPEDSQWKLLEQPGNGEDSNADTGTSKGDKRKVQVSLRAKASGADTIIEPPYVIVDTEIQQQKPDGESKIEEKINKNGEVEDDELEELTQFVNNIIVDSLKVEVGRRLSTADTKAMKSDLARDMEQIAYRVSLALQHDKEHKRSFKIKVKKSGHTSEKVGTLYVEHIIKAISFAIHDASCLRRVLPVGVIVGSSLAALRRFFTLATMNDGEALNLDEDHLGKNYRGQAGEMEVNYMPAKKADQNTSLDISRDKKAISKTLKNDTVMVGAVTAALGASALLAHQQDVYKNDQTTRTSSMYFKEKVDHQKGPDKLQEAISEKTQNNVVTSLAEKAMSVAAPVVPTKEDGELDQERLVAMMTELGQKGGLLRLVGKIALLWGGIRGAMSLTDRLILFLRIAERPLLQRILAFVGMVLVLWSPVVVPLLPRLVQSWATHNSSRFSELACIVGLYIAVMFLVMLWGKRIRGYDNPLQEYGLDFAPSSKKKKFLKAFIGGAVLVLLIQTLNALLGWVSLSLPSSLPSSSLHSVKWLKVYGRMLFLAVQGIVTASAVTLVEELVFRSWLPEEISTDLGYHHGIILSGLAFSLLQRSPQAIPGLLLLSLALAGARQRSEGSLLIPIGLRAGIMASSFILEMGGFLTYQSTSHIWVSGIQPTQPFSGIVGLAFSLLLAVILYPRQPLHLKKTPKVIRE